MVRKTGHEGLVLRDVKVTRGGKQFTQKRWIRGSDEEPEDRKGKKEEIKGDSKGKKEEVKDKSKVSGLSIGDKFLFLGNKMMSVEKISEKEQTAKLSNGIVYTIEAIAEIRKRKESESKAKEEKPKEKTVKDLKPKSKKEDKKEDKKELKLTADNRKDILVKGKWINIDGKSAIITDIVMDMFIDYRFENGKDGQDSTMTLIHDKDVKSEDKTDPIPKKFVFKPVKSKKTIKGKMEISNVDSIKSLSDMNVLGGINEQTTHVVNFKGGSKGIYKTSSAVSTQGEMNFKGISKILGWDNAPETVKVDLGKGEGSCQRWVENIAIDDINEVKLTEKHYDDLAKIAIIDMITGNWDRHFNNVRLDTNGKIWAIDNDTWGDETQYNVNKIDGDFYTCKLGNWSGVGKKDNHDEFQSYCDKYVKEIINHKDEITKFINGINKNDTKFKDDHEKRFQDEFKSQIDIEGFNITEIKEAKDEFRIDFGEYQSTKELTDNMLSNLNRVIGDKK